jgi:hypothetical protein
VRTRGKKFFSLFFLSSTPKFRVKSAKFKSHRDGGTIGGRSHTGKTPWIGWGWERRRSNEAHKHSRRYVNLLPSSRLVLPPKPPCQPLGSILQSKILILEKTIEQILSRTLSTSDRQRANKETKRSVVCSFHAFFASLVPLRTSLSTRFSSMRAAHLQLAGAKILVCATLEPATAAGNGATKTRFRPLTLVGLQLASSTNSLLPAVQTPSF